MSELVAELRRARPSAPEGLRERIAALAAQEPEPEPSRRRRLSWWPPRVRARRLALVLVPACLALAVLGALAGGLARSGSDGAGDATGPAPARDVTPEPRAQGRGRAGAAANQALLQDRAAAASKPSVVPPSRTRYQDYAASMRIRLDDVDALSGATQRAMRLARRLGGYVVAVAYGSRGARDGEAYLTLRVPVARVQEAVVGLSRLGTILGQNVRIDDVQPRVDALERRIVRLRSEIAAIDGRLRSPGLGEAERAQLEFRRERLGTSLRYAVRSRRATIDRARFATVSLELTTQKRQEQEAAPGLFERTLDDAGGILLTEAAWTLLILAVVAPFVVLIALAAWGVRTARRLADRRLLESS